MSDKIDELIEDGTELVTGALSSAEERLASTVTESVIKNIKDILPGSSTQETPAPSGLDALFNSVMSGDRAGAEESLNGFEKFVNMIAGFLPNIGFNLDFDIKGMFSNLKSTILGFIGVGGDGDTENTAGDDQPTAEEQAALLEQQQQAELLRQQELARQVERESLGPSPETTQDEFERAHDNVQRTPEEQRELDLLVLQTSGPGTR